MYIMPIPVQIIQTWWVAKTNMPRAPVANTNMPRAPVANTNMPRAPVANILPGAGLQSDRVVYDGWVGL
jgi:hypothetical protein